MLVIVEGLIYGNNCCHFGHDSRIVRKSVESHVLYVASGSRADAYRTRSIDLGVLRWVDSGTRTVFFYTVTRGPQSILTRQGWTSI